MDVAERLRLIEPLLDTGPDRESLARVMDLVGAGESARSIIGDIRIYGQYVPKVDELGFTEAQRHLHFLWELLDRLPISINVDFAFPFRRMIAERLFKACGGNFICEEGVRFNFGQNISVGDDVFFNRGCYLDSKGGLTIGDRVGVAEFVTIFTHSHSESVHEVRSYAPVVIEEYAKIYCGALILPGVTVGRQAIVAARAMVSNDVPPNALVAGSPAKPVRERKNEGRSGDELHHVWFKDGAFQEWQPFPGLECDKD